MSLRPTWERYTYKEGGGGTGEGKRSDQFAFQATISLPLVRMIVHNGSFSCLEFRTNGGRLGGRQREINISVVNAAELEKTQFAPGTK